jgi:uncharacterized protein YjbJ (UPF0337 family)
MSIDQSEGPRNELDEGAEARDAAPPVEGHWRQIHARAQVLWDKLTADEWAAAGGDMEKIIGLVEARYGQARHAVVEQLNAIKARIRENAHLPYQGEPAPKSVATS